MLNSVSKTYRIVLTQTLLLKQINKISSKQYTCICGERYTKKENVIKDIQNNQVVSQLRVHSTQSDTRRQKVVIETVPKIEIDKLRRERIRSKDLWERIDPYIKLARWDKPIGVYLLYWPGSWSIALASLHATVPLSASLQTAGLFLIGAGLMRGAGCTINDMWDRDVDAQVERTRNRPLVSGAVSKRQALAFLALQLSGGLAVLCQLNCYSVVLGASSMVLVILYPLAKRFTNYPQIFLGATFNWGALLGYSAIQGAVDPAVCVPLYMGALAWTVVYDTIYAHQDKNDDARIGMKSTALTYGSNTKAALSAYLAFSVASLYASGVAAELNYQYNIALLLYAAHVGRQIYTLNPDCPDDCASKFKSNSLVGLFILLGILGGGYEKYRKNREKNKGKDVMDTSKSCIFG